MKPSQDQAFVAAHTKQADALVAIGRAIDRLAQAVENGNAVAVKRDEAKTLPFVERLRLLPDLLGIEAQLILSSGDLSSGDHRCEGCGVVTATPSAHSCPAEGRR